ncbi:hypothetical protein [Cryptosporangium phraense]|uniref:Uncharacterized protein n=1 Tax=Cryptosporangium phraense TaxID=2593070 RepID=A0A545ARD1_9ACTN|nr:hypothetical protein [Cryptosporangium phraense]TQS43878.1 hypothetical protein FL583_17825 [Cryptosporangium phraense]
MNRIDALDQRYRASESLVHHGVEIVAVGDPAGARLNQAIRDVFYVAQDDLHDGPWGNVVGAAKSLRWRRMTHPQPVMLNSAVTEMAELVAKYASLLHGAVEDVAVLDELVAAAMAAAETDSPLGSLLLSSVEEVGTNECVVVAASKRAQVALTNWLGELGILVLTAGELERLQPPVDQSYLIGPPRFFRSSVVTAPVTSEISFLIPAWFGDRTVPRSAMARYAEGALEIKTRVFVVGNTSEPGSAIAPSGSGIEDDFLPEPVWGRSQAPSRSPKSDEVLAHRVLLSGGWSMCLEDDGERIRALDPDQPPGERIIYVGVSTVRPGTYLVLRQGEGERSALYREAYARLGADASAVEATQNAWKQKLQECLFWIGQQEVVRELRARGVTTAANQARAWTDPYLVRPTSDADFAALLKWLEIPAEPTAVHANRLRRAVHQAAAAVRERLEAEVSAADLSQLELTGSLSLGVATGGFRSILATRVLAISPHPEIVARHETRVLVVDRSAQWLE